MNSRRSKEHLIVVLSTLHMEGKETPEGEKMKTYSRCVVYYNRSMTSRQVKVKDRMLANNYTVAGETDQSWLFACVLISGKGRTG